MTSAKRIHGNDPQCHRGATVVQGTVATAIARLTLRGFFSCAYFEDKPQTAYAHYNLNEEYEQQTNCRQYATPHPDVPEGGRWLPPVYDRMPVRSSRNKACVLSILSYFFTRS
jgi:hypothetical protein